MSETNIDEISKSLQSTRVTASGVSFAGKSLKLDSASDAQPVIEAINKCENLQFLNLQGNTLGVEASKAIVVALEKHPEFKRALWKDMFTGRTKTEIPLALEALGKGLVTAGTRLTELDLSDNAFGPIGMSGLAALLRSTSCYALEELRLNNNGLGITGGRHLASALTDCFNNSKACGKPLALKVFIAGRNRLENDGAKALAAVFKMIGTLEEIAMPQNGIYHPGILALAEAFTHNKNLQILNLNDNTIGPKGAEQIAKVLPQLTKLKTINFGDCLLKTGGAIALAAALRGKHEHLEEIIFDHNEIKLNGGLELANALENKIKLKLINLNGNQFGSDGLGNIKDAIKNIGKLGALESLSENESEDSDEAESEGGDGEVSDESCEEIESEETSKVTVVDFLNSPSDDYFSRLGENKAEELIDYARQNGEISLETLMPALMKVSALAGSTKNSVAESALQVAEKMYQELFSWAEKADYASVVNNTILVNLGLIKDEDKFKPTWNTQSCIKALNVIVEKTFVPESTKNTLSFFLHRSVNNGKR